MKKLLRAALLTVVMFVGANAQAVRDQADELDSQTLTSARQGCVMVNGMWICTDD